MAPYPLLSDLRAWGTLRNVNRRSHMRGALCGITAAALFGLSAPLAKVLVADAGPVALASVFYLSASSVLFLFERMRGHAIEAPVRRADVAVLFGVTLAGGVLAPVSMLVGLSKVSGVAGALLLNLEAPFTMLVAVSLFGEHLARREAAAAGVIVAAGALLAAGASGVSGSLLVCCP
jgi:drug/metabolite transporter (DMT)-like permease